MNYGYWTLTGDFKYDTLPSGRKLRKERCICICGKEKYVQRHHLRQGASTNCGCIASISRSESGKKNKIHGMDGTHPYIKFGALKRRCNSKNNDSYYRYGGRGIKCEWETFQDFWNDMGESYYKHLEIHGKKNTTIDRIDVNGNYCKDNCRWATLEEQGNNRSNNHYITYKGETLTISQATKKYNIKGTLLRDRIRAGWKVEDAIEKPVKNNLKTTGIK